MDQPKYEFTKSNELYFDFFSVGKKGVVYKRVRFHEISNYGFYNMGLCDVDPETDEENYNSITDNGDRDTVLATIAEICETFFNRDYALDFIRKEIRQNSSEARKFSSANAALAA